MNKLHIFVFTLGGFSLFILGMFFGEAYQKNHELVYLQEVITQEKENISVVNISEVSPLGIKGSISGNKVRLFLGDEVLDVNPEESFQIDSSSVYKKLSFVIPENTQFFASSKGKKFYSIDSTKKLESMKVQNLVFFNSRDEAEQKGFVK